MLNYTPGGDTSTGGTYLADPGIYHFIITAIDEAPTKKSGELIDNAMFRVDMSVLAGTTPNQRDKNTDLLFFHPKPGGSEGAHKLSKKKVDRFLLATCLATKEQIEKCEDLDIDLVDCVGRQLIAKFDIDDWGDKPRLALVFAEIYHVDDVAMEHVSKCEPSLNIIDPALRWIGGKPGKAKPVAPKSGEFDNL